MAIDYFLMRRQVRPGNVPEEHRVTIVLDLTGRIALVTGGTRGVGRGIASRLLDAGAEVIACGRNGPGELPTGADGRSCHFLATDVRDPDAVDVLVTAIVEGWGSLDLAVNNAGGSPVVDAATASPRFTEKVIALNLTAALHVAQRANTQMQSQPDGGAIVNVASMSGLRPSPRTAAYGAAKAGLVNLTRTLAVEWAPKVRVNAVAPGIVRTEQFEDFYGGPTGAAAVAATVPQGRVAEPTEVGDAVAYLASPLASFVSGAVLEVHGGGEALAFTAHLS
ncbi:MAG: SDR family oxidoreductase [Acidimicrobiales bacterium]